MGIISFLLTMLGTSCVIAFTGQVLQDLKHLRGYLRTSFKKITAVNMCYINKSVKSLYLSNFFIYEPSRFSSINSDNKMVRFQCVCGCLLCILCCIYKSLKNSRSRGLNRKLQQKEHFWAKDDSTLNLYYSLCKMFYVLLK